jgi:hypothetical protein
MSSRNNILAATAITLICSAPAFAADDAFSKDLKATIALNGQSCDQIVESKRNGDSDYTATCKDGNKYRVYVNAQGRVIVQKM